MPRWARIVLAALLLSGCANAAAPGPRSSAHATTLSRDASVGTIYAPAHMHRRVDSLDAQWKFFKGDMPGAGNASFDDSLCTPVTLPHTWNALDGQDGPQTPYYRGVGWYRKHFTIAPDLAGRKLYLQFDGANIITDAFVSRAPVGRHAGRFATFRFDSTRLPAAGAAIVEENNRVVQLLSSSKSVPANGRTDVVLSARIAKPHLWSGLVDPYSYRVFVEVGDGASVTDLVDQPLGLRSFALDPNAGFSLNGAYLDLHGVNMHQDAKDHGWAAANADTDAKLAFVKEIGATSLRLAHYQHSQHTYDMTDRMGLVVWAEAAIVNRINASTEFAANAKEQLTELIRQNSNHPSIVFWGIGNEVDHQPGPSPDALIASLASRVPAEDPTRIPADAAVGNVQETTLT